MEAELCPGKVVCCIETCRQQRPEQLDHAAKHSWVPCTVEGIVWMLKTEDTTTDFCLLYLYQSP